MFSEQEENSAVKITSSMNKVKIFVIEDDKDKGDDGLKKDMLLFVQILSYVI